jgi:hypothetical protein
MKRDSSGFESFDIDEWRQEVEAGGMDGPRHCYGADSIYTPQRVARSMNARAKGVAAALPNSPPGSKKTFMMRSRDRRMSTDSRFNEVMARMQSVQHNTDDPSPRDTSAVEEPSPQISRGSKKRFTMRSSQGRMSIDSRVGEDMANRPSGSAEDDWSYDSGQEPTTCHGKRGSRKAFCMRRSSQPRRASIKSSSGEVLERVQSLVHSPLDDWPPPPPPPVHVMRPKDSLAAPEDWPPRKGAFLVRSSRRRKSIRDSIVAGMRILNFNMSNINPWRAPSSLDTCLTQHDFHAMANMEEDNSVADNIADGNLNMNNFFDKFKRKAQSGEKVSDSNHNQ